MKSLNNALCLSAMLIIAAVACSPSWTKPRITNVKLERAKDPPVFQLNGDSYFLTFTVTGPFPTLQELQHDTGKYVSVWEINTSTTSESHTPIEKLPAIIYGALPAGFAQFRPYKDQPAPKLEAGKFYRAEATATHGKSDGRGGWIWEHSRLCFSVGAASVSEVPCVAPGEGGYGYGPGIILVK